PGSETFDKAARDDAERVASEGDVVSNPFRAFAGVRNDLLHAQYSSRSGTRSPETIRKELEAWLAAFEAQIDARTDSPSR
ncbi:MAG: hypothetical protein N2038_15655, partial [Geminicoccaceae bacterium]|nr:hypothetical protein [Geminicoccaceae bacterium]